MKEMFANSFIGIAGLLIFFVVFAGILLWVFRPGATEKYKKFGNIPLEDDTDDRE